ncbi:MAG TPA: galactose-1-epimerase [Opitutae bacterium]|nr:galactose-1-epimerase [Opitutae bacterium]
MSIDTQPFGKLPSGETVHLFTLRNQKGLSATITNYGGIIVSLNVPDRDGNYADVILGKDTLEAYLAGHPHFACITGRVAGRIAEARFEIDGQPYRLVANNNGNCLHGGLRGFDKILWQACIVQQDGVEKLRLSTTDPDGSNGFPGNVDVTVTYALLEDNTLEITYLASSDKTTPLNLTNHAYINLGGHDSGDVLQHSVQIFSDSVATVDQNATLLGRRDAVVSGYNDFRQPIVLKDLDTLDAGNADIHYFLPDGITTNPKPAATVIDTQSGRKLEVFTTEPGVQFYAGLALSEGGPEVGKGGAIYPPVHGLCLETQDYANSINHPDMGNAVLKAGDTYTSTTLFKFSTE